MIHGNQYLALERPFLYPFLIFENSVIFLASSTGLLMHYQNFVDPHRHCGWIILTQGGHRTRRIALELQITSCGGVPLTRGGPPNPVCLWVNCSYFDQAPDQVPVRARVGSPPFVSPSEFRSGDWTSFASSLVLQYWYVLPSLLIGEAKLHST